MDTEKQFNKQLKLNNCETKNENKLFIATTEKFRMVIKIRTFAAKMC